MFTEKLSGDAATRVPWTEDAGDEVAVAVAVAGLGGVLCGAALWCVMAERSGRSYFAADSPTELPQAASISTADRLTSRHAHRDTRS